MKPISLFDALFLLSWKRILVIICAFILSVVLHNVIYALFYFGGPEGGDEPFFFFLAVIGIPCYFVASLAYTVIRKMRRN